MPVSIVSPSANSSTRMSTVGALGDREGRRHQPVQQRHRHQRDEHAERPADAGEQQALGHQLADHPLAAGAHRRADGQLAPAPERAGEQQVGEVRAGDQQHARRRAAQRDEQQPRLLRHFVAEADDRGRRLAFSFGYCLLRLRRR